MLSRSIQVLFFYKLWPELGAGNSLRAIKAGKFSAPSILWCSLLLSFQIPRQLLKKYSAPLWQAFISNSDCKDFEVILFIPSNIWHSKAKQNWRNFFLRPSASFFSLCFYLSKLLYLLLCYSFVLNFYYFYQLTLNTDYITIYTGGVQK